MRNLDGLVDYFFLCSKTRAGKVQSWGETNSADILGNLFAGTSTIKLNVGRRRVSLGFDGIGQHQYWPPTAIFVCQHFWWILWTDIYRESGAKHFWRFYLSVAKWKVVKLDILIYGDLYTTKIERWKVNPEERSRWSRVDKGRRFLALHDLILGIVSLGTFLSRHHKHP